MRARLSSLLFFLVVASPVRAEPIQPENITAGKIVRASESPDGKYCLVEVFGGDTTATAVIFTTAGRIGNLGMAPVATEYSTDRPYKDRLGIVWSADSTRVAIHDSLNKHSEISIYRLVGGRFERIPTPDLLAAACARWGIARENVVSSGQRPLRWPADEIVEVEVSARLKKGGTRRTTLQVHAPQEGKSIQQ